MAKEQGTGPSPRQHGLVAALAVRREQAVSLWERAKHTWPWIAAGSIVSDQHAYGPIGTMMALFETLVGLGLAVHLGAVIGARYGATSPTAFGMKRRS